jgi:hypothetical protein
VPAHRAGSGDSRSSALALLGLGEPRPGRLTTGGFIDVQDLMQAANTLLG